MGIEEFAFTAFGSIVTGVVTGWASAQITIAKLSVHVEVLRETVQKHEREFVRVHQRIDDDTACRFAPGPGSNGARRQ